MSKLRPAIWKHAAPPCVPAACYPATFPLTAVSRPRLHPLCSNNRIRRISAAAPTPVSTRTPSATISPLPNAAYLAPSAFNMTPIITTVAGTGLAGAFAPLESGVLAQFAAVRPGPLLYVASQKRLYWAEYASHV